MIKIYKYGEVSNSEIFARGNIASGVREAVKEHGFFGAVEGSVSAAGAGISASVFSAFTVSLFFKWMMVKVE